MVPSLVYFMKPFDLSGAYININLPEGRVGTGPRHQTDVSRHGAEELCPGIDQYITNGKRPALGDALKCGIMGKAQVSLYHHGSIIVVFLVSLEPPGFCFSVWRPGDTICSIYHFGDLCHPVSQFHLIGVQKLEIVLLFAGFLDSISQLQSAVAAVRKMGRLGTPCSRCLGCPAYYGDLFRSVSGEDVDAHYRIDAGSSDDIDVGHQVFATPLHQLWGR